MTNKDRRYPQDRLRDAIDVRREAAVNAGVQTTANTQGGADVLVSNAGTQFVHKLQSFPYDDWKKLLPVHLDGAFLTTKPCLPQMYKAGSSMIIGRCISKTPHP